MATRGVAAGKHGIGLIRVRLPYPAFQFRSSLPNTEAIMKLSQQQHLALYWISRPDNKVT